MLRCGKAKLLADVHIDIIYILDWLESPTEGWELPYCSKRNTTGSLAYPLDYHRDSSIGHQSGDNINPLQV